MNHLPWRKRRVGRCREPCHAKPDGVALGLEAGKGGHFTKTQFIYLNNKSVPTN